jgi:predicted metal-dependent phosphoesterase TrpH
MRNNELLKADFHIHTQYSMDCSTTLDQVIRTCQEKGINCIAIADHGAIEGALKMKALAPFPVIIAEEILTTSGEIMGMFLNELVPSGLSIEESISRIKAQGGLLCAQHPFDRFRKDSLKAKTMDQILDHIDLVEVFNARNPLMSSSRRASRFAQKHCFPGCAGSDAHAASEIGKAYVEMPEFKGKEDFLQALARGQVYGQRANPLSHFNGIMARIKKIF